MSDTADCKKCDREISSAAEKCPECGYEPSAEGAGTRRLLGFVGGLLCITVIGAVIGIPLLAIAFLGHRKVKDRKPTTYVP